MKGFICVLLGFAAVISSVCWAGPEPAVIQGPGLWTVDVKFEQPQQIMVRSTENNKPVRYWYVILTLTNNTAKEVEFVPCCELLTDTFRVVPACLGTNEAVFAQIKKRHQGAYPFLESIDQAGNRILCGEDNCKDIAIIWPDFDDKARSVKLFIKGLSNETAVVEHPTAKDEAGQPVKVFLRKTLELNYELSGDQSFRGNIAPLFKGKTWVMR
jgi:hypothetical protein